MWLPVLRQLGYRPVLVFLRDKTYLSEVQDSVPAGCAILTGHDWRVFGTTLHPFQSTHTAFVDGKPSPDVFQLCVKMTLSVVFGIDAPRKVPPGWMLRRVLVEHHLVGGVTTTKTFVVGCIHTTQVEQAHFHVPPERPFVARDLSTVLDATTAPPRSSNPLKPSFSRAAEKEDHLAQPWDGRVSDLSWRRMVANHAYARFVGKDSLSFCYRQQVGPASASRERVFVRS